MILKICSNLFSFSLRAPQLTINLLIPYLVDAVPVSSPLTESRIDNVAQTEDTGMDSVSVSPKGTDREKYFSELSFYNCIPDLMSAHKFF